MLTNNMIGIGMLALPFALKQAGLLFVAAFIVVAVIMSSTLLLIGHLLELVDGEAAAMGIPRVLCSFFSIPRNRPFLFAKLFLPLAVRLNALATTFVEVSGYYIEKRTQLLKHIRFFIDFEFTWWKTYCL